MRAADAVSWKWWWAALLLIGSQLVVYHEAFVLRKSPPIQQLDMDLGSGESSWRTRRPAVESCYRNQRCCWKGPGGGRQGGPLLGAAVTGTTRSSLPPFENCTAIGMEAKKNGVSALSSNGRIIASPPTVIGPDEEDEPAPVVVVPREVTTTSLGSSGAVSSSKKQRTAKKVAVLLNLNARSVTEATVELARQVFDGTDNATVYVTRTEAEAIAIAPQLLECDIVVPIGGDGTLTSCLNVMKQQQQQQQQQSSSSSSSSSTPTKPIPPRFPDIAYIPLGTGNAVGSVAGCVRNQRRRSSQLVKTMQLIRQAASASMDDDDDDEAPYLILELPIMEVQMTKTTTTTTTQQENRTVPSNTTTSTALCFFCGAGFDSLMLDDFRQLQKWSARRLPHRRVHFVRRWLGSVAGYCVALVARTLPAAAFRQRHQVHVKITAPSNENDDKNTVLWLDHRRGDVAQRVVRNGGGGGNDDDDDDDDNNEMVVYEGRAGIVAASTVPYYGGNLRLFPFARVTLDQLHLRIGRIHPLTGFFNIPKIFTGSYRDPSDRLGVLDYLGREFHVQFLSDDDRDGPKSKSKSSYPFQHSGESVGDITSFRLKVADQPIRFVSFWDQKRKG
jgi:hypothetical protein